VECKRLQNRVNDTTKSREKWRDDAKELARRVRELEAENAALHSAALHSAALHSAALHSAALKKQG
jgi:prefoldin subunit 5